MEELNYSKRELDEHFKEMGEKIDKNTEITQKLDIKVGIANGRTGKLEGKFNAVALSGSVAVFLIGIIMSLIVYSFKISQENLKSTILLEISQQK